MLSSVDGLEERGRALLLRMLERGNKTSAQLKEALLKAEIPEEIAKSLISRFSEVQLIDDSSYASDVAFAARRVKGLGKAMVSRKLQEKGLSHELIEEVVQGISDEDELKSATELAKKRWGQLSNYDQETRKRRLVGFLQRRGFKSEIVFAAIREAESEAVKSEV